MVNLFIQSKFKYLINLENNKENIEKMEIEIAMLQKELDSREQENTKMDELVDKYQLYVDRIEFEIKQKNDEDSVQK